MRDTNTPLPLANPERQWLPVIEDNSNNNTLLGPAPNDAHEYTIEGMRQEELEASQPHTFSTYIEISA